MELIINGRYDEAFSHLLLFGLASILEDADDSRICTCLLYKSDAADE